MTDLGPRIGESDWGPLEHCLIQANATNGNAWALEFGVGKGSSLELIASFMPVVGFDSFKGLPEDWREGFPKGTFAQARIPEVPGATIVRGEFKDTLPHFDWPDEVSLIHMDADLYSSTITALAHTLHYFKPGLLVVFDEFHGYEGAELHEQRAWAEFSTAHHINWKPVGHNRESFALEVTA